MTKSILKIMMIGLSLYALGCNKGFQNSSSASSAAPGSNQGQGGGGTPPSTTDPLQSIDYKGRPTSGGTLAGQGSLVLEIDRTNQALIMILPIPAEILPFMGPLVEMPISELPGAKIMPYNKQLAVSVPLKYIVRGGQFMDKNFDNALPNGDPLPKFPAGEGAGFALNISGRYVVHLYIGVSAGAAFVETPSWDSFMNCAGMGLPICLPLGPFEVMNEAKTEVLGYVALVPAKNSYHSGVYVASQFSDALARFIDDHIKY